MAKNNLILAGALLVVLLFAYEITFTEERLLQMADHKVDHESGNHATNVMTSSHKTNLNRDALEDASDDNVSTTAYKTNDFRPTTPGHSPGAGH
ncbi:hypothetical protein PTKIN_Ptkin13bG0089400 [Pterospermum kingtungense]